MEKKQRCKLCNMPVGTMINGIRPDMVRVKTDLFGKPMDEVFHEKCWLELKIPSSIGESE